MKFKIGDIVKVNDNSSLRKLYAFDNDLAFIVKQIMFEDIIVLPYHKKEENYSGLKSRPSKEFYLLSRRRELLLEKKQKQTPKYNKIFFNINNHFLTIFNE